MKEVDGVGVGWFVINLGIINMLSLTNLRVAILITSGFIIIRVRSRVRGTGFGCGGNGETEQKRWR